MGYATIGSTGGGGSVPTFPTYTAGRYGLSSSLTSVSSSASANAKGSDVSLGTLTQAIDRLELLMLGSGNASRHVLIDIKVGGVTYVSNLPVFFSQTGPGRKSIRCRLPAGDLTVGFSANVGSLTLSFLAFGYTADITETATVVEPIGPVNATAVATTGVAPVPMLSPTWTPINGLPTTNAYKEMIPHISTNNDTGRTAQNYILEFAMGTSGSQISLGVQYPVVSTTGSVIVESCFPNILVPVPAGSLLWTRVTALTADAAGDTCNVQLHGIR